MVTTSVSPPTASKPRSIADRPDERASLTLFSSRGERKYLNASERERILDVVRDLEPPALMFTLALFWTGARVSEVLALTAEAVDVDQSYLTIRSLKRRGHHIRQVPVPPIVTAMLDRHFDLRRRQACDQDRQRLLWPFCRQTAWRMVKRVMFRSGIHGPRATPKGFRHAFAIAALHGRVPLNMVQRWMGHARMETTAIYSDAIGPDEHEFAALMWAPCSNAMACLEASAVDKLPCYRQRRAGP